NAGNTYIAGFTDSLNFPMASATQPVFGGGRQDAFVVKLDPTGTRVIYSTYLGGDQQDNATGIAVDVTGNVWLTGFTASTNFPVMNAFQPNRAGLLDAFVSRLDAGGSLVYSTHLGGSGSDYGSSVVMDASGNVYVSGMSTSVNFPLASAMQSSFGGVVDMYVAKFNASGRQLVYSTFLGGAGIDGASSIAVDSAGSIYVTGLTSSPNLRIVNALQPRFGGGLFDAFVAKLNASGSQLIYSTYLGGSREDRGLRVAIDDEGNAYVTGDTDSFNFTTTTGALQANTGGGADAFVAKLNSSGNQLIYSSYLGGSGIEAGTAIAVDARGSAIVTGFTGSTNFPTSRALQQTFGGGSFDGFVAKIGATGTALDYSSYLGGTDVDSGFGVAMDAAGSLFIMGLTRSIDFPTAGALQRNNAGGASDLFVAKIKPGPVISDVSIRGKNLFVAGGIFDQDAVILLDGEQQKTVFQSSTELKGKKVARKIFPGQAVRLQVRNADGLTSSEFNYTRP
ncbi:MAG TPA: SBBP repeat-containing protein, partial [Blastocatellia bacterium]|nr:SBBP repeat-containing protein [Blastocatellia bacterium]